MWYNNKKAAPATPETSSACDGGQGVNMKHEKLGIVIFVLGILSMFVYTAFSFLWAFSGTSSAYPLAIKSSSELVGAMVFFSPPIGALLMVIGGLVHGLKSKEAK